MLSGSPRKPEVHRVEGLAVGNGSGGKAGKGAGPAIAAFVVLFVAGMLGCSGKSGSGPSAPSPPSVSSPTYDVDALGVPQFATSDYIDLSVIHRISRFRSSVGHDAHDDFEACRSMKHYFEPRASANWAAVPVYSPVQGTVTDTLSGWAGITVRIRSTAQPAFTFGIFHVNPGLSLERGTTLSVGQQLGTHIGSQTYSDIEVGVATPRGYKLISWFEVMTDGVFQGYAARGVGSRQSMIISRAERDADPLACNGETFTSFGSIQNWVTLR